jgi:cholest-4-en-3-one 26-monooxygenase
MTMDRTEQLRQRSREQLAASREGEHAHKGDHPLRTGVNLIDGDWYARDPHEDWAWMRENAPVYHDPNSDVWAITRYEDLRAVSTRPGDFSNHENIRPKTGHVPMMISMDDPEHAKRRRLVSRGFTPRRVADKEPRIREICDGLLDRVLQRGECDFVWDVAAWLPLIVIADMLGVAPEDHERLLRWSDLLLEGTAGDLDKLEEATTAFGEYYAYQAEVIEDRRGCPRQDLVSVLIDAEVDGQRLDDESLIWESLLILIGGDETTRHVISGGMLELLRHPDALARLREDPARLPRAIEEMLRWVSPIKTMSRTVTRDVELGGQTIPAGDEVLLTYPAANRDGAVFADADVFDIDRVDNPHVAFGHGPHFCLGASLARLELKVLFERVLERMDDIELAVAPEALERRSSSFVSGLESLPLRFAAR